MTQKTRIAAIEKKIDATGGDATARTLLDDLVFRLHWPDDGEQRNHFHLDGTPFTADEIAQVAPLLEQQPIRLAWPGLDIPDEQD